MPKRKRDEDTDATEWSQDDRIHQKLRIAITNGVTRIATALEQARRFERQKLGKRQHDKVRGNDVNGRKINIDIAVLKGMDMKELAKGKLYKNLSKTTSIAKTGLLPDDVASHKSAAPDKTTADLMARLFKQKHVAEAMDASMTDVRKVLGLGVNSTGTTKASDTKKEQLQPKVNPMARDRSSITTQKSSSAMTRSESGEDEADEEEFLGFSSRVASSSGSDEGGEESDAEDTDRDEDRPRRLGDSISVSGSEAGDDDGFGSESDSEVVSEAKLPVKTKLKTKKTAVPPSTSAFDFALTGGGYMSNSDSDATDIEEHVAPRKNRRGQRARQKIWEQKFKDKAKHVVDPKKDANSRTKAKGKDKRGDGWDAQRGAMGPGDDRRRGGRFGGNARGPSGGNAMPLGDKKKKHKDDEGPLHPSWEARKMAKKQDGGIGGFAGKKLVIY